MCLNHAVSSGAAPQCWGMGTEGGLELGKPWWGEQGRELPPDLRWGCWCCCCDLVKHEGLTWQVAECWSCWESRVLTPAWLYNQLSTKHPALVYGAGLVFLLYSHAQPSCSLHAWMGVHDCNMHALLGLVGKDKTSCRFDVSGLTSDSLAADAAPALFLVLSKENQKTNPVWFVSVIAADLDWILSKPSCYYTVQSPQRYLKKRDETL